MFDCVMPTRAGRTGRAFTSRGVLNMRNACHAEDSAPIDPACACPACARHSRAYVHHLFKASEMLGPMLLTWHNLTYYQTLMQGMRVAILEGRLAAHADVVRAAWGRAAVEADGEPAGG
jgi:queuine tRNA-ribosyltransferase